MEEKRWKTSENNWKIDENCWKNNEKARNPTPNKKKCNKKMPTYFRAQILVALDRWCVFDGLLQRCPQVLI